jgi:hypothetical protein
LWYGEPDAITNAIGYAKFRSRSYDAVIRVYDQAGNVIERHEHAAISKNRSRAGFPLPKCRVTRHNPHNAIAHEQKTKNPDGSGAGSVRRNNLV